MLSRIEANLRSFKPAFNELPERRASVLIPLLERDVMGNAQQKNLKFTTPYARTCHQAGQTVLKSVKNYWKSGPKISEKS